MTKISKHKLTAVFMACLLVAGMSASPPATMGAESTVPTEKPLYTEGTYGDLTYKNYGTYIEISGCDKNATSVEVPAKIDGVPVTKIGSVAFINCNGLTSVTIPDSILDIQVGAFAGCSSLTSVSIPDSVTIIGKDAFHNCTSLIMVTIPDNVTFIASLTFAGCIELSSVTIPDSVTSIRSGAFSECTNLTDVYYSGTIEQWENIKVEYNNDSIQNATIHFNSTAPQEEQPEVSVSSLIELNKALKIKQGAPLKYDLNGDNIINVIDLALLKRQLLGNQ